MNLKRITLDDTVEETVNKINENSVDIEENVSRLEADFIPFKDNITLKTSKIEKELNDYKAAMQQININQEPKQKVSGYGIVSLPPNAANGQVSAKLLGQTLTNTVVNGDFKNELNGWSSFQATNSIENGNLVSTLTSSYGWVQQSLSNNGNYIDVGKTVFLKARVKIPDTEGLRFLRLGGRILNTFVKALEFTTFIENQCTEIYTKYTIPTDIGDDKFFPGVYHQYTPEVAVGKKLEVDYFIAIELDDTELLNMSADEINKRIPYYFNDTKSTVSASRLKSVNKDGTQESVMYLPNVGELRSLPNGTKDEIRVSDGKLIKRVSDWITLDGSESWILGKSDGGWKTDGETVPFYLYDSSIGTTNKRRNGSVYSPDFSCYKAGEAWFITQRDEEGFSIGVLDHVGIRIAKSKLTGYSDELSDAEKTALFKQWLSQNPIRLIYQLAEPIEIPVQVSGSIVSYPNGTIYIERILPDAGVYTDKITILHQDAPIKRLDKLSKVDFMTGVETELDVSEAVIAEDKLSFTHPELSAGDIVFFEYEYDIESTEGEAEVEFYDSRYVVKDTETGKFYKWNIVVANGQPSIELVEV